MIRMMIFNIKHCTKQFLMLMLAEHVMIVCINRNKERQTFN